MTWRKVTENSLLESSTRQHHDHVGSGLPIISVCFQSDSLVTPTERDPFQSSENNEVHNPHLRRDSQVSAGQFLDGSVRISPLAFHDGHDDVVLHVVALVANMIDVMG